ncbi:hypothetical protein BJ912DRAFT_114407 [Pholiota molesta]|nr:hypothetical protein BJ912DRAFT_114407 [Pholiota molesta]
MPPHRQRSIHRRLRHIPQERFNHGFSRLLPVPLPTQRPAPAAPEIMTEPQPQESFSGLSMGALYRGEEATPRSSAASVPSDWHPCLRDMCSQLDPTATSEYGLRSTSYSELDNTSARNIQALYHQQAEIPVQLTDQTQTGEFPQDIFAWKTDSEVNGYLNEASQAQAQASSEASSRAESEYWRPTSVPEVEPMSMYFHYTDLSHRDPHLTQAKYWDQTHFYSVSNSFDVSAEGSSADTHSQHANGGYDYPQDGSRYYAYGNSE